MTDDLLIFKRIVIGEIVTEADFAKCNGTAELARRFYAAKHEGLPDHKLGEILIEAKLSQDDITSIFYSPDNADEESLFHNKYIKPLFSVSDALKPQPPIDWAIDKLVEFGGVMGIFGKPGSKKNYAMMSLAMCLATGKKWLDFEVKQCPVLW
ncbi:MAG: AAA family ATPase, partial [Chloroflexota bacterium]